MAKKFVYFYFMKNEPDKIGAHVPEHISYWKNANLPNYSGGPFADRTGGLIIFDAEDLSKAEDIVNKDPFVTSDLIENGWVKEWMQE